MARLALIYATITYLVVVVITLVACQFMRRPVREGFNASALELRSLRAHGKRLAFPYYQHLDLNASERAKEDPTLESVLTGKCALVNTINQQQPSNDSLSIVHENNLAYMLKKSCLALRARNPRVSNNNRTLTVTFLLETTDDIVNMSRFVLANPLFVEFSLNTMYTVAYVPRFMRQDWNGVSPFRFQNFRSRGTPASIDIVFDVALQMNDGMCDKAFDYRGRRSALQLTNAHLGQLVSATDRHVHTRVFYIDPDIGGSFQNTGRTLNVVDRPTDASVVLFDANYPSLANDPRNLARYEFMNNLALHYHNFIPPTLTYRFVLRIGQKLAPGTQQTIVSCNINNLTALTSSCADYNLWGMILRSVDDSSFELSVRTEDGNRCGQFNTSRSPPVSVVVPYPSGNSDVHVTLTLTPNEKRLYVDWQDLATGTLSKRFVYGNTFAPYIALPYNICTDERRWNAEVAPRETNFMTRVFSSRQMTPRQRLETITLRCQRPIVHRVGDVSLGHLNYLRQINDA